MDPNYPKTCPKNPDPSNIVILRTPKQVQTHRFKPTLPLGRVQPGIRVGWPDVTSHHQLPWPNGVRLWDRFLSWFHQLFFKPGSATAGTVSGSHQHIWRMENLSGVFFFSATVETAGCADSARGVMQWKKLGGGFKHGNLRMAGWKSSSTTKLLNDLGPINTPCIN